MDVCIMALTNAIAGMSSVQTWLASFQHAVVNLVDNPWRRTTVPQFIIDARHPWILANLRKLERLPDAEAFLCSTPNSSNKEATEISNPGLEIPPDLLDYLEIDNSRYEVSRPGWPNALERLREMKRCPWALAQVKTFKIEVYVHNGEHVDWSLKVLEPLQPPAELLELFGDVLEAMTSLETLKWGIPKEYAHWFEEAFMERGLTLPSVKWLEPGSFSQYLVAMCPQLETLENGGGFMWYHAYMADREDVGLLLVRSASSAPKLTRFAMEGGHDGWTQSLVSEVVKSMPQIQSLGLHGSLGTYGRHADWDHFEEDSGMLKEVLGTMAELEKLTHLDLPSSSRLGLGFDGGPPCGNAYVGKEGGGKYQRRAAQQGAEASERGSAIVIAKLPHLTSFTIGGTSASITRTDNGTDTVTWPWTRRMAEWLMEEVPEESNNYLSDDSQDSRDAK